MDTTAPPDADDALYLAFALAERHDLNDLSPEQIQQLVAEMKTGTAPDTGGAT